MEERFQLKGNGGWITVKEEGLRVVCYAEMPDTGRGLYKLYLNGRGGDYLLGTMMPEGKKLCLRRVLTVDELKRREIWPPSGGETKLAFSAAPQERSAAGPPIGWAFERCPQNLMGDRLLMRAAAAGTGVLIRRGEEGFALAFPWNCHAPFQMEPLFCFACVEGLEGRDYAVFHFNRSGCPIFPHKEKT